MTKLELYCNFRQAEINAEKIAKMSREIKRMSENGIASEIENIDANWNGEASEIFLNKCRTLQSHIEEVVASLNKTADTIKRVAKRVYDTETKALEIAKSRTYR